jgi:hypothetical protein
MDRAARRDEYARWMNREEPCLFEMVVRRTHLTRHDSPSTPHPFASSRHAFLRVPASRAFRGPLIWKSGGSLQLFGRQVHIPHARNRPLAGPKRAGSYSRCCITIRAGELVCSLEQLNWRWANWGRCLRRRIHLSGSANDTFLRGPMASTGQAHPPNMRPCAANSRLARVAGHFDFRQVARHWLHISASLPESVL